MDSCASLKICPITIKGINLIDSLVDNYPITLDKKCLSNINSNIEILLNGLNTITPLACIDNLVHFSDLLNFGENKIHAFIIYAGDINLDACINLTRLIPPITSIPVNTDGKDLIIMSVYGNITIHQPLTARNIYILAPHGTITLSPSATLTAHTILLSAQNAIVYDASPIIAHKLMVNHDMAVDHCVQYKIVNTLNRRCGYIEPLCSNPHKITLTKSEILTGGLYDGVDVVSRTNSTITILVSDYIDLEITADSTQADLVFEDKSLTIITAGSLYLPQGLITTGYSCDITLTAGHNIIAQGSGINAIKNKSGASGFINLKAGKSIIISGERENPVSVYNNLVSGINSYSYSGPSSDICIIAGGTIKVISSNTSFDGITGINSCEANDSGSVSVIALQDIQITSGNGLISGVNSHSLVSKTVLVSSCNIISFNDSGIPGSFHVTGHSVIFVAPIIKKDGTILITDFDGLVGQSPFFYLNENPCKLGTDCLTHLPLTSVPPHTFVPHTCVPYTTIPYTSIPITSVPPPSYPTSTSPSANPSISLHPSTTPYKWPNPAPGKFYYTYWFWHWHGHFMS